MVVLPVADAGAGADAGVVELAAVSVEEALAWQADMEHAARWVPRQPGSVREG